jgi:ATP-dependent Clp protease adaptor protein ClpS
MDASIDYAVRKKHRLKEPEDYKVILLNDDYTSMDFVVFILSEIFHKSNEEAEKVMYIIHNSGRAVAGVYSFDLAKTKSTQVHNLAQQNNFPLKCILEKA